MSEINDQLNDLFDSMSEEEEIELSEETGIERPINEVSPPGWGHTKGPETGGSAKAFDDARKEGRFKGSKEDMFAIMWAGKNKGDKTHYKPKSNPPEKKKSSIKEDHIQATADRLGQFISSEDKKTRRAIDGLNSLTEEEKRDRKIQLLENEVTKLAQMTRAHFPGEGGDNLVSGIGQGGDGQSPGSGAVWLWDLNDVEIGTPLNGQYPTIANGSILKFSSVTNSWLVGTPGTAGGVTTADVFLVSPVTQGTLQGALQTLPVPSGDIITQEDANQWFKSSILDLDDRLGGEDGNIETAGNLDFMGSDAQQSIRKYNGGTSPSIAVELAENEADLKEVFTFTQNQNTSLTNFGVFKEYDTGVQSTDLNDRVFGVQIEDANNTKNILTVFPEKFEVGVSSTFKNVGSGTLPEPNGDDTNAINNTWAVEGYLTDSNSNFVTRPLLYRINSGGIANSSMRYQGLQVHNDDLATVGYVQTHAAGDFLPLIGGTLTGDLTMEADIVFTENNSKIEFKDGAQNALLFASAGGTNFMGFDSLDEDSIFVSVPLSAADNLSFTGTNQVVSVPDGSNTALSFQVADDSNTEYFHLDSNANEIETTSNVRVKSQRIYLDATGGSNQIRLSDNRPEALKIENHDGGSADFLTFCTSNSGVKLDTGVEFNTNLQLNVKTKPVNFISTDYNSFRVEGSIGNTESDGTTPVKTDVLLKTFIRNRDSIQSDYIEYFGDTSGGNMIMNRNAVAAMINSGGEGTVFHFKGPIDATDNANYPDPLEVGDYYMNTTAGTAGTAFSGLTTLAVNQLIIFTANTPPWQTGASQAPADVYVPLTGNVNVTGPLTFTEPTGNFIVGPTGSNISLGANGVINSLSTTFSTSIHNTDSTFAVNASGNLTANAITANNGLSVYNGSTLFESNIIIGDHTQEHTVNQFGTFTIKDSNSDPQFSATSAGVVTVGGTLGVTGATTLSAALNVTGNSNLKGVNTLGQLSAGTETKMYGSAVIEPASSGDQNGKLTFAQSNGKDGLIIANNGNMTFGSDTAETVIQAYGHLNKKLTLKMSSNASNPSYFDSVSFTSGFTEVFTSVTFNNTDHNNKIIFQRGTATAMDGTANIKILGYTAADPTDATGNLFTVNRRASGTTGGDDIRYFGNTDQANSIQTKQSVEDLINNVPGHGSNLQTGGMIEKDGGLTDNSGNLIIKQTSDASTGRLYIQIQNGTSNFTAFPTGSVEMGTELKMGQSLVNNSLRKIVAYGTGSAGTALSIQNSSEDMATVTEGMRFGASTNRSYRTFKVGTSSELFTVFGSSGNVEMGQQIKIGKTSSGSTTNTIAIVGDGSSEGELNFKTQTGSGGATTRLAIKSNEVKSTVQLNVGDLWKIKADTTCEILSTATVTDNREFKFEGTTTSEDPKARFSFKGASDPSFVETLLVSKSGVTIKNTSGAALVVGDNSGDEYFKVVGTSGDVEMGSKLELGRYTSQAVNQTDPVTEIYVYGSHDTINGNQKFGRLFFYGNDGLGNGQTVYNKVEYGRWTQSNLICKTAFKISDGTNTNIEIPVSGEIRLQSTSTDQNFKVFGATDKKLRIQVGNATSGLNSVTDTIVIGRENTQFYGNVSIGLDVAGSGYSTLTSINGTTGLYSTFGGFFSQGGGNSNLSNTSPAVTAPNSFRVAPDSSVYYFEKERQGGSDSNGNYFFFSGGSSRENLQNAGVTAYACARIGRASRTNANDASTELIDNRTHWTQSLGVPVTRTGSGEKEAMQMWNRNVAAALNVVSATNSTYTLDSNGHAQAATAYEFDQNLTFNGPLTLNSAPTDAKHIATKEYVDSHSGAGAGAAQIAEHNTFTNKQTIQTTSGSGLQITNCDSTSDNGFGALSFKFASNNSNNNAGRTAHVLFQGSGNTNGDHPGEYIFGRDTATNNVAATDKFFTLVAPYGNAAGVKTVFNQPVEVPTPTADSQAATKAYVDSHSNSISGGFQMGNWTATFDSSTTAPNSKVTKQGTYVKVGKMVHLNLHFTGQNFTGYEGTIRIKGVPFRPNTSMGKQIGTIHAVGFMVNNYHADDGHIALLAHDSTFGSHIKVISEQVNNETHYITNASGAEVSISITYISE